MIKEHNNSTWQGKAYSKIVDTTQQVTSFPVVVRPMENTIPSWTINGNMVQDGTPTPQNPITPSECGDLSENLYDASNPNIFRGYYNTTTNTLLTTENNAFIYVPLVQGKKYYVYGCKRSNPSTTIRWATTSLTPVYNIPCIRTGQFAQTDIFTITAEANENYLAIFLCGDSDYSAYGTVEDAIATNGANLVIDNGYKIPISSASTTTPVYLGEVQSTRQIKKLVLTGGEAFSKNDADSTHYLYYGGRGSLLPNSIEKTPLLCNELPVTSGAPQSQVGISSNNNFNVVYLNFGADVMNAQPSGNTPNGVKEYLAAQYAAGTPVCVWYVLATETTGIVNEPLRKIGTYSDSVSGTNLSVTAHSPTAIDVDTSLKPSEMDLTYTGLKMCGRKKYAHGNSPQILPSAKAGSRTSGNMTLTCDGNGVYTLVGSPTPNAVITFDIPPTEIPLSVGEGGNGTLSLFNDSVYNNFDITFIYQGTPYRNAVAYRPNTLNKTSTTYGSNSSGIGGKTIISIGVRLLDYGDINCTFSPMITNDGQLPSTFQPYCSWQ